MEKISRGLEICRKNIEETRFCGMGSAFIGLGFVGASLFNFKFMIGAIPSFFFALGFLINYRMKELTLTIWESSKDLTKPDNKAKPPTRRKN